MLLVGGVKFRHVMIVLIPALWSEGSLSITRLTGRSGSRRLWTRLPRPRAMGIT